MEARLAQAEQLRVIDEAGSRDDAYVDCGFETVTGADVMLVARDGEPARCQGGTADVVAYALSLGKPLRVIDPETLAVRRESWERFHRTDATLSSLNRLPAALSRGARNPFNGPPDRVLRDLEQH